MMMKKLVFLMSFLAMAGCSSKPPVDPNIALCPEASVSIVQANQRFMDKIVVKQTPTKVLQDLDGLVKKATLVKAGEPDVRVAFYQTGLPQCPWMMSQESLTPVLMDEGTIIGFGADAVKDRVAKGWVLKEANWPWQGYDFGYLPRN